MYHWAKDFHWLNRTATLRSSDSAVNKINHAINYANQHRLNGYKRCVCLEGKGGGNGWAEASCDSCSLFPLPQFFARLSSVKQRYTDWCYWLQQGCRLFWCRSRWWRTFNPFSVRRVGLPFVAHRWPKQQEGVVALHMPWHVRGASRKLDNGTALFTYSNISIKSAVCLSLT